MKKNSYSTAISIDTETSTIHRLTMIGADDKSISHQVKNYSGSRLDDVFFQAFRDVVAEFVKDNPSQSVGRISLILPDNAVALDSVNVPTMKNTAATRKALSDALSELYRNIEDLKIQSYIAAQNKQYTTFGTVAVQNRILTKLYSIFSENHLVAETTTYAAGASIAALSALDAKLKNATYLFLDIKDTYSRFVFVVNGRAAGFFHLPFGLEFLNRPRYIQEDMLFDHTMGELTVLNAKEKAKARKLSVLAEDHTADYGAAIFADGQDIPAQDGTDTGSPPEPDIPAEEPRDTDGDVEPGEAEVSNPITPTPGTAIVTPKYMAKKTPRKLPRFMQRPIPETPEDIARENFRVFAKWALTLLATNERITALGAPAFVSVNLPKKLSYVLDAINEEKDENRIEFRRFAADGRAPAILSNLELYGGFFPKLIHRGNQM